MIVLVIDDELVIRTLAQRILQKAGYAVVTASSGEEGVAHLRRSPQEVDLVIIDARMPGLSGEETLRQIREVSLAVPCIVSSGSMDVEQDLADDLRPNTWFLQKPYQSQELLALVATITALRSAGC